jgi:hypothetical protein
MPSLKRGIEDVATGVALGEATSIVGTLDEEAAGPVFRTPATRSPAPIVAITTAAVAAVNRPAVNAR